MPTGHKSEFWSCAVLPWGRCITRQKARQIHVCVTSSSRQMAQDNPDKRHCLFHNSFPKMTPQEDGNWQDKSGCFSPSPSTPALSIPACLCIYFPFNVKKVSSEPFPSHQWSQSGPKAAAWASFLDAVCALFQACLRHSNRLSCALQLGLFISCLRTKKHRLGLCQSCSKAAARHHSCCIKVLRARQLLGHLLCSSDTWSDE